MKRLLGLVVFAVMVAGCAGSDVQAPVSGTENQPVATKGFLGDYYRFLAPGPPGGAKMRWLKPGVDFSRYDRVMMDSVIFYYSDESEDFGIDAVEMKELTDIFNKEIVYALKGAYPIVSEPAPDVIRLRIAVTDLKKNKPALSAISTVIPVGLGVSLIKKGTTGAWSGAGEISIEVMALDSASNEVIAVAQDSRSAGFTERFSEKDMVKEAADYWSGRIREYMDNLHGK